MFLCKVQGCRLKIRSNCPPKGTSHGATNNTLFYFCTTLNYKCRRVQITKQKTTRMRKAHCNTEYLLLLPPVQRSQNKGHRKSSVLQRIWTLIKTPIVWWFAKKEIISKWLASVPGVKNCVSNCVLQYKACCKSLWIWGGATVHLRSVREIPNLDHPWIFSLLRSLATSSFVYM